jgi:hypothetical protein
MWRAEQDAEDLMMVSQPMYRSASSFALNANEEALYYRKLHELLKSNDLSCDDYDNIRRCHEAKAEEYIQKLRDENNIDQEYILLRGEKAAKAEQAALPTSSKFDPRKWHLTRRSTCKNLSDNETNLVTFNGEKQGSRFPFLWRRRRFIITGIPGNINIRWYEGEKCNGQITVDKIHKTRTDRGKDLSKIQLYMIKDGDALQKIEYDMIENNDTLYISAREEVSGLLIRNITDVDVHSHVYRGIVQIDFNEVNSATMEPKPLKSIGMLPPYVVSRIENMISMIEQKFKEGKVPSYPHNANSFNIFKMDNGAFEVCFGEPPFVEWSPEKKNAIFGETKNFNELSKLEIQNLLKVLKVYGVNRDGIYNYAITSNSNKLFQGNKTFELASDIYEQMKMFTASTSAGIREMASYELGDDQTRSLSKLSETDRNTYETMNILSSRLPNYEDDLHHMRKILELSQRSKLSQEFCGECTNDLCSMAQKLPFCTDLCKQNKPCNIQTIENQEKELANEYEETKTRLKYLENKARR